MKTVTIFFNIGISDALSTAHKHVNVIVNIPYNFTHFVVSQ